MRLFLHQLRGEQRLFWRSRELAFFTFLLPIVFLVLLGSVYGEDERIDGVRGSNYLLAGMLGYGVAATAFAGLAIMLVLRRETGVLKRVRSTPLPPATYVAAILSSILIAFALEALALIAIGRLVFDIAVPDRIGSLAAVLLLGGLAFAALGVGLSAAIRSAEGASALVNAIYLPMAFISGSFFSATSFPRVLELIGEILPLTYFIRLVRAVILHDEAVWEQLSDVGVLAAWGLVGAIVALRYFRWEPRSR
ncbi:MAG: ABC transporter permease [Actinobacteria bacterium]|nr:ABC transporter permease [Actinomycetota bacterium]